MKRFEAGEQFDMGLTHYIVGPQKYDPQKPFAYKVDFFDREQEVKMSGWRGLLGMTQIHQTVYFKKEGEEAPAPMTLTVPTAVDLMEIRRSIREIEEKEYAAKQLMEDGTGIVQVGGHLLFIAAKQQRIELQKEYHITLPK